MPKISRSSIQTVVDNVSKDFMIVSNASDATSTSLVKPRKMTAVKGEPRIRYRRCNECPQCLAQDCRICIFCIDMKKYGGSGTRKRCCEKRICSNLIPVWINKQAMPYHPM